jgi:cytochrome d ubiquinol oxidase subunit II
VAPLWVLVTLATAWIQPDIYRSLFSRPWLLGIVLLMVEALYGVFRFSKREQEMAAFLSSSAFLLCLMAATLAGNYPFWLRSTLDPAYSLTAVNAASEHNALGVGMVWWILGIILAVGYFSYVFRSFQGKVDVRSAGHGK